MKKFLLGACAALLLLAPGSEAAAKSIKIQASGTVAFGNDDAGLFGDAGADLAGRSFSFEAVFDLSQAVFLSYGGFRTDLYGGENFDYLPGPTPPSFGDSVFSIGGVQRTIHNNATTGLTAYHDAGYDADFQFGYERHVGPGYLFQEGVVLVEQPSHGFFGPDYQPPSGNLCTGGHICNTGNYTYSLQQGGSTVSSFAQLDASSITITEVPEPSTWVLMLTGFGLGGAALRSRRRALAA